MDHLLARIGTIAVPIIGVALLLVAGSLVMKMFGLALMMSMYFAVYEMGKYDGIKRAGQRKGG